MRKEQKHTEESKRLISETLKRIGGNSGTWKKEHTPWNKGINFKNKEYKCGFKKGHVKYNNAGFKKGNKSWNKGLTKIDDKRVRKYSNKISKKLTGRKLSEEWKEKIIKNAKNNPFFGMKGKKHKKSTIKKIKESRKNIVFPLKDTTIEVKIQNFLKTMQLDFTTHNYMEIEHGYQCDILIPKQIHIYLNGEIFEIKHPMIIEADGDYWHSYPKGREIDYIRTKELIKKGYKVIRLWERDIRVMKLNEFKEMLI